MSESRAGSATKTATADADERVERLFEDYSGRVYRYCLNRLGSPEEAEDALQATYLNAWRSLKGGVRPLAARPWLFQIASNVCSAVLRTRLGRAPVELRSPESLERIPTTAGPRDELLGLSAALAQLPERQRRVLLLRDWRGLSYDEIATEIGASYGAVETLLFRARNAVATGLTAPQPAVRAPVRARALAPLPLFIPLAHGWSAVKSTLASAVGPVKGPLLIAVGASAPLVAFGVLELSVWKAPATTPSRAAPAVGVEGPLAPLPYPSPPAPSGRPGKAKAGPPQKHGVRHRSASQSPSRTEAAGATQGSPAPAPPPPAPAAKPPAAVATPAKVTMCHHTGSTKNPGVTITVAAAAVAAHLARRDELGACPG